MVYTKCYQCNPLNCKNETNQKLLSFKTTAATYEFIP